jgi:4-hydroxy-3-polyprenylbenzoate decarboxylase
MSKEHNLPLVLAVTGASCAHAAARVIERSAWPVSLVMSRWGEEVYRRECGQLEQLVERAATVISNDDLAAPISSGSVPTAGMVILPCSSSTLAAIAAGLGETLIARAAHCHLKERRFLVLCVREAPWSLIDLDNARTVAAAGGVIMPLSPPCYMSEDLPPDQVTLTMLLDAFADRVLALLGQPPARHWGDIG